MSLREKLLSMRRLNSIQPTTIRFDYSSRAVADTTLGNLPIMNTKPALMLAASLAAVFAWGDPKKEIQALYTKAAIAMKQKNVAGVLALGTPELTYKTKDGRVLRRSELESQLKSQFKVVKVITKVSQTILTIKVTGTTAEVTCKSVFEGRIPNPQTKKDLVLKSTGESRDIWIKGASGWKLKSIVETSEKTTVDGKPLQVAPGTRQ